jgi:hypothetical protein
MRILKVQIARRLTLVIGATSSGVPDLKHTMTAQARKLRRARERIKQQQRQIKRLQQSRPVLKPENIVWILGTARTGSTWLGAMMSTLEGHMWWREPRLGQLFGSGLRPHEQVSDTKSSYREQWLRRVRPIILGTADVNFTSESSRGKEALDYLVIQDPNGSAGAPWLLEAVPESRMIFLVRDPRDVAASHLDAYQKGSWAYMNYPVRFIDSEGRLQEEPLSLADTDPDAFVEQTANRYVRDIGNVKRAYDAHRGPKVLVRYEDLRANTLGEMRRIYSTLGVAVDEEGLARAVRRHAWENIPENEKGKGKMKRKATPGGWRDDLSPEQLTVVETVTAHLLGEFYPKSASRR